MAKTKQQIRVLLADDHAIFRDGLRKLLGSDEDIVIVGEAQNGAEAIKMLAKLKPDILLLDLQKTIAMSFVPCASGRAALC